MRCHDDSNVEHHSRRICALTHRLNTGFVNHMRENDQKRKMITSRSDHRDEPKMSVEENQILMTKQKMKDWVKKVCCLSRVLTIPDSQSDLRQQQRKRVIWQFQSCSHVWSVPRSSKQMEIHCRGVSEGIFWCDRRICKGRHRLHHARGPD